jgi:hypothetical protein
MTDFKGKKLDGADFSGQVLIGADFRGASLVGARFARADLTGAQFRGANVSGADFTDATLADADLSGLREAESAHWPEGFDWRALATPPGAKLTEEEKLQRAYFDDAGKLKEIPVGQTRQRFVLLRLVEAFEKDVRYPEKEVNERLKTFHPDFATLRRYLIDHQFMNRENNIYWRL